MGCNWLMIRSFHCPNLVRIGCNADFLSRFQVTWTMVRELKGVYRNDIFYFHITFYKKKRDKLCFACCFFFFTLQNMIKVFLDIMVALNLSFPFWLGLLRLTS